MDRPISAAAVRRTGRISRSMAAGVKRAACTPTLTAATTRSPRAADGHGNRAEAELELLVDDRDSRVRARASISARSARFWTIVRGVWRGGHAAHQETGQVVAGRAPRRTRPIDVQ